MTLHEIFVDQLERKGIVSLADDDFAKMLVSKLADNPCGIEFLAEHGLAVVFIYEREKQPRKFRKCDGLTFKHVSDAGDQLFSIGIATSALLKGTKYVNQLWLHEAAHILHGTDVQAHDQRFREVLQALMEAYNESTGADLAPV